MTKYIRNTRFWLVAIVVVWIGLIVATAHSRSVVAQTKISELKPPFQFVEQPVDQPLVSIKPPGSSVIMTETFGAGFNPVTTLTGTVPLWRKVINPTDTAGYYWGRVDNSAPVNFRNSAWSAVQQAQPGLPLLTPGVSTYPAGQDTWLLYGPIDLSKYTYATLSFEYYLNATTVERLMWGVTVDGSEVIGYNSLGGGSGSQWITGTYQFDQALWGNNAVYLAFGFRSGASPNGLGAFIRNVSLRGEPYKFVYMPIVMRNYPPTPTPTATPTPLFGYTFDESNPRGAGSDLSKLGGKYDGSGSGSYGPYGYGQDVSIGHGNPTNSLRLYTTASYITVGTGPNSRAPANFDLYLDTSPWRLYPADYFGVVFGASDDTIGANPGGFNGFGSFYFLYYGTGDISAAPLGIRLDRCSGGNCTRLSGNSGNNGFIALPPSYVGNSIAWDRLHLQRNGNTINVWVNDTLVISLNDGTYVGQREWGLAMLAVGNDPTYPPVGGQMAVDFDNIRLYPLP